MLQINTDKNFREPGSQSSPSLPNQQHSTDSFNSSRPSSYLKKNINSPRLKFFKDVDVPVFKDEGFKYAGSTASAALLCKKESTGTGGIHFQIQKSHEKFRLEYVPTKDGSAHSGIGIQKLIDGEIDFAISSRKLKSSEEKQIQDKKLKFKTIQVAQYPLSIVVNSEVGVSDTRGLTLNELDRIFAGEIENWNGVEGANQRIIPYVHEAEKHAPYSYARGRERRKNAPNTEYVKNTTQALRNVAKKLGGIYRAPAPMSFGQRPIVQQTFGQTTTKTIPVINKLGEVTLPYTNPQFNPLKNCENLSSGNIIPASINSKYPKNLQEQLYVIYSDYPGDENLQEQAGRAYAELLLTDEGQKMLDATGFQRLPDSERNKQLQLVNVE